MREYGEAAARVGEAAKDLDHLIARFDERLPEVKAAMEEIDREATARSIAR